MGCDYPVARLRVFVAEAVAPVRARLRQLVTEQPGCELVGEDSRLERFVGRLPRTRPHLVILGSQLEDATSFDALERMGEQVRAMKVILLCEQLDGRYLFRARSMGADYVLESPRDIDVVTTLLKQIATRCVRPVRREER